MIKTQTGFPICVFLFALINPHKGFRLYVSPILYRTPTLCGFIFYMKGVNTLTDKQKRFCEEYLIDCNATQAAIRAGYSKKTAKVIGSENLTKPDIKNYIEERMQQMQSDTIASAEEVLKYLTSVVRGESRSTEIVVEGIGEGCSTARTMLKEPSEKERLKAAELLGKRYALFTDRTDLGGAVPIVIKDDLCD